jgi:hypothetical protein
MEEIDFDAVEAEMMEARQQAEVNQRRSAYRAAAELAAGVEVDAIQAGLPKALARAYGLYALRVATGFDALA